MVDQISNSNGAIQAALESGRKTSVAQDSNQVTRVTQTGAAEASQTAIESISYQEALKEIDDAIAKLNEVLATKDHSIRFRRDETLNRSIITVVNDDTGEVVRQLPTDEMLQVARNIENLKGVLVKEWV
jgi:flagellar protein FlaG